MNHVIDVKDNYLRTEPVIDEISDTIIITSENNEDTDSEHKRHWQNSNDLNWGKLRCFQSSVV